MESASQRAASILHELELELAARDREILDLKAQLPDPSSPVTGLSELLEAQRAQLNRSRNLLNAIAGVSGDHALEGSSAEEVRQLRAQLEAERGVHDRHISELTARLESAHESAAALESMLLGLRGAMQRIEAKFSLYASAVLVLTEPAPPKGPTEIRPPRPGQRKLKDHGTSLR